jgi:hypothetical protein
LQHTTSMTVQNSMQCNLVARVGSHKAYNQFTIDVTLGEERTVIRLCIKGHIEYI